MPKDQKKKVGRQNYDWAAIKHDYVTSPDMSLRKIADKYGIRRDTVYKRSKAESWFATRKKTQAEIGARAIAKTTEKMASELAQESTFLMMMKGHMDRMLSDHDQFQRMVVTNVITGETEERVFEKFDSRAMKDSMQTLKMIEEMTRSLYNLQKAETIQRHQIEAERLQLEREKFEFEKQKAEFSRPDSTNTIRIEGFENTWSE